MKLNKLLLNSMVALSLFSNLPQEVNAIEEGSQVVIVGEKEKEKIKYPFDKLNINGLNTDNVLAKTTDTETLKEIIKTFSANPEFIKEVSETTPDERVYEKKVFDLGIYSLNEDVSDGVKRYVTFSHSPQIKIVKAAIYKGDRVAKDITEEIKGDFAELTLPENNQDDYSVAVSFMIDKDYYGEAGVFFQLSYETKDGRLEESSNAFNFYNLEKMKPNEDGSAIIPFETVYEDSNDLPSEKEEVIQEGVNGALNLDGTIKKEPVNKIIRRGTSHKLDPMEFDEEVEIINFETKYVENKEVEAGKMKVLQKGNQGAKSKDKVVKEAKTEIVEVGTKSKETREEVPFETVYKEDTSLKENEEKVVTEGVNGAKINVVDFELDEETGKLTEIASTKVIDPINKVIAKGVKKANSILPNTGENSKFSIIGFGVASVGAILAGSYFFFKKKKK